MTSQGITQFAQGRVVVGYDGSEPARAALHWATRLAERLGVGVGVLTAQEMVLAAPHELGWAGDPEVFTAAAQNLVDQACALVNAWSPQLSVLGHCTLVGPAAGLVEASEHAVTLVLGSRGASPWGQMLLGSVSDAVATHARCPVVVVRAGQEPELDAFDRPVVLGVDDSAQARAAAASALRYAEAFDVPVRAVHAWATAFEDGVVPTDEGSPAHERFMAGIDAMMDAVLAGPCAEHPGVRVERVVRQGAPARVLAQESEGAGLLVVGSRGRGGFRGLLLGSTSRNVLVQVSIPVAVVRARD